MTKTLFPILKRMKLEPVIWHANTRSERKGKLTGHITKQSKLEAVQLKPVADCLFALIHIQEKKDSSIPSVCFSYF